MTTTLAQRVVAGLKDKILAGDLPPGHKLPSEADLIGEYRVSRTVVREAVTRLRAEGLIETFHGRGSFVLAMPEPTSFTVESAAIRTHHDVLDMIDFRLGIECEAAALAAARVDVASTESIRAALDALMDYGRPAKVELCILIDRRFSRELPIQPDYVGKAIDSILSQKVKVFWKEKDDREEVCLLEASK